MRRALLTAVLVFAVPSARAQTIGVSCPEFFQDRHQAVACAEALFSQSWYHFTLASLPPSNGFGPGLVLTKSVKGVAGGSDYETDLSLGGGVTTNGSWVVGGDLLWLPPLPYKNDSSVASGFKLGKLKTLSRANLEISAQRRDVNTLYFYGFGPASPNTRYTFAENDTTADVVAKMPLTRWLIAKGGFGARSTTLPLSSAANSVDSNFTPATAGIQVQPTYVNGSAGAETLFTPRFGRPLQRLDPQDDPHFQSLLLFTLQNNFAYHWQKPTDGSPYAYRQFVYEGDETIAIHQILRNFFPANRHPVVRYVCESNKQTDECAFGQIDVKTHLVLTQTSGANQIPFYLQPTLGGTDVDSQVSLRGWDNYRFRARDLALVQFEYGIPVYDPVGLLLFYDAGTVGNTAADLTVSRFRQDAGIGATVRLRGHVLAQTYFAWGAGHGAQWNYNFAKSF